MAKQSFKTAVGAFVIGGLALLVAGIILLGGGRMFSDDIEYVLYFDGSVSGLNIGAPVVFRGVPMGQVTRISLEANPRDASVTIPVYIRLDENSIVRAGVTGELTDNFRQEILRRLIQRGLRARLQLQSLITGQYRVELDFLPNTPANFRSPMPDREIPTLPSPIDTLQRTVASLPLEEMAHTTAGILEKLNAALSGDALERGIKAFATSFEEAQALLAGMQESQKTLAQALEQYTAQPPKGEFVLVVAGAPASEKPETEAQDAEARLRELLDAGMSRKDAVRQTAQELRLPKNAVYELALNIPE